MRILHTADLHIGQILYQNYERSDEHQHYFEQLKTWCHEHRPDALLVSGDVFDIQIPGAAVRKHFNDTFTDLQKSLPAMHIVIIAGNHDSASRLQADSAVWSLSNTHLVGVGPAANTEGDDWHERYIIELEQGYIIAMPYLGGERTAQLQSLLDNVARRNTQGKPVVMMGHVAVTGSDITGHDAEIGTLRNQDTASLGTGYDYLALGHIHKPQTIGHSQDCYLETAVYPAPVVRYSGSALHVSCDETYPHSVSLVDIDRHGGQVAIRQLTIDQLRHFHTLPPESEPPFDSESAALMGIGSFCKNGGSGYIRLRVDLGAQLASNFDQEVYQLLEANGNQVRYNPKIVWVGQAETCPDEDQRVFELAELQQMDNPKDFILKTRDDYPGLELDHLDALFEEIETEIRNMLEAAEDSKKRKKGNAQ